MGIKATADTMGTSTMFYLDIALMSFSEPDPSLRQQICKGATALSLSLTDFQADHLTRYVELLAKWNSAYNLTAIRDPKDMISRHIIDSLSIVPHVRGDNILDVGSGPGLPGICLLYTSPSPRDRG